MEYYVVRVKVSDGGIFGDDKYKYQVRKAPSGRVVAQYDTAAEANAQADYRNSRVTQSETQSESDSLRDDFDKKFSEYEGLIKKSGAELSDLAQRRGARQTGLLTSQVRNALLATGADPTLADKVTLRAEKQGERNLGDILQGIDAQTKSNLAGAKQFGITSGMGLEGIATQRQSLADAMMKFLSSQNLERDKIQASLDMQPSALEDLFQTGGEALLTYILMA